MKKDRSYMERILDRYFAGESTLAEEQELRAYFEREDIPAEWEKYRALFQYFKASKAVQSQRNFEVAVRRSRRSFRGWWAYAAAIALLLSVAYYLLPPSVPDAPPLVASTINWEQFEPASEAEAAKILHGALKKTANALQDGFRVAAEEVRQVEAIVKPLN